MDTDIDNMQSADTLLPERTKQVGKIFLGFFFYSILMFTLPFAMFFLVQGLLERYFDFEHFTVVALSVFAVVITVNLIIIAYAYKAYHEKEYDEDGNEITFDGNDKPDLKQD